MNNSACYISKVKLSSSFFLVLLIFLQSFFFEHAFAAVSSCTASVSPGSIPPATSDITFTINNTDSVSYNWIKIISPSSNFSINQAVASGWSASTNTSNSILTGGTLSAAGSLNVAVGVTPVDAIVASENWTVQVSDNGGSSTFNCSGSLGMEITASLEDSTPQVLGIVISDITSSSVKITWTTDEASNSVVNYGTTESYGSTKSDSTLVTSHSFTLDSLTANTTYYFTVSSTDNTGNTGSSGGASFTTAKAGLTSETVTITKTVTPTPTPTPVPDTTRPAVIVSTDFSKPFSISPQITGKASDNKAVSKVEYSLDGGKNWLSIALAISGKASFPFSFTPDFLDDGNYNLQVRAADSSSNIGYSKKHTLVIDRLSPQVSGILFSLGPQVINPRQDGSILIIGGQPLKITLSEVGGSTKVEILALNQTNKSSTTYSLTKNPDNGLWSGVLPLKEKGEYQLKFKALDGAGNKTETDLNKVVVVKSGRISSVNGNVSNAKITVYYQEPRSKAWQIWDGGAYSQTNPQKTDKNGNYSLFLPAGKYYLQIESYGYQKLETEFFSLDKPQPINANFTLKPLKLIFSLSIIKLYWPDFSILVVPIKNNIPSADKALRGGPGLLIGRQAPYFSLVSLDQTPFDSNSLRGKPSVITFLNTWSPSSAEQISILNNFAGNKNFNSATIIEGEKFSKVYVFKKRGSYSLPMYTDPDAALVTSYNLNVLPTSYFIDRKGIIKDIAAGVLSESELEERLIQISN